MRGPGIGPTNDYAGLPGGWAPECGKWRVHMAQRPYGWALESAENTASAGRRAREPLFHKQLEYRFRDRSAVRTEALRNRGQ
jgi:hypothetical protein